MYIHIDMLTLLDPEYSALVKSLGIRADFIKSYATMDSELFNFTNMADITFAETGQIDFINGLDIGWGILYISTNSIEAVDITQPVSTNTQVDTTIITRTVELI